MVNKGVLRRLRIIAAVFSSTPTATTHLIPHLLKLFPLFGREHFLQTFVSLPANLANPRLGFLPERLQLVARLAEYLLHLRLLFRAELQAV